MVSCLYRRTTLGPSDKYSVDFMKVDQRIDLLAQLGEYCVSAAPALSAAKRQAQAANGWFTPEFIDLALHGIATEFLQKDKLRAWAEKYRLTDEPAHPRTVGLVMAGNIPLVGFHDFLCLFISGHRQLIKPSGRDEALIRHLAEWLSTAAAAAASPATTAASAASAAVAERIGFAERLNGCDAYIATGSNNSARYFEYYFGKYPHLIRRNRTSVALLTGQETTRDLELLADDVYQYFGLGCRNVTQLYVPEHYDFLPLLETFRKYDHLADLARYKNNYDYQLTLLILNKNHYLSNQSILLAENPSPFSPISVLHYVCYRPGEAIPTLSGHHPDIQCIVGQDQTMPDPAKVANPGHVADPGPGRAQVPFGQAQSPGLTDYADGVDTLQFLQDL
jgi:hypothetical protein